MSESLRTLLIAIFLLLCVIGGWFFLHFHPRKSQLASIRERTEDLLSNIQSFRTTSQEVARLDAKIAILQKNLAATSSKLITKKDLSRAVKQIAKEGRKYGLAFDKIIPDYSSLVSAENVSTEASPVMRLTLHLKMRGRYKSFGRFLKNLEHLPFGVSAGEISLVYDESLSPRLRILMDAVLFLRRDSGTKS